MRGELSQRFRFSVSMRSLTIGAISVATLLTPMAVLATTAPRSFAPLTILAPALDDHFKSSRRSLRLKNFICVLGRWGLQINHPFRRTCPCRHIRSRSRGWSPRNWGSRWGDDPHRTPRGTRCDPCRRILRISLPYFPRRSIGWLGVWPKLRLLSPLRNHTVSKCRV